MRLLKIGDDQWARADEILYVSQRSHTLRVDCRDRETLVAHYDSVRDAETAAETLVAQINEEIA